MAQLNRIILLGIVVDQPELRVTTEGKSFLKFTLETERQYNAGKTDKISIVAWEKVAEEAEQLLSEGVTTLVDGRIQIRSTENAKLESTEWITEVVASYIKPLVVNGEVKPVAKDETEDDIPF